MQTYMTPRQHFRIARNGGLTIFLTLAFIGVSWCQGEGVLIEGELRHKETRQDLQKVTVTVMLGDDQFDQFEASGSYSYEVPFDGDYLLIFGAVNMIPQSVLVNASQVPEGERGDQDKLTWPVMLFDYVEGFNMSLVDEPLGIFNYDEGRGSLEFDRSHSSRMKNVIDEEKDRLSNQGRDQERNRIKYEYAMEDAQKAERKERWDDALAEYQQALELFPGDADALAGLERVQEVLNPTDGQAPEDATTPDDDEEELTEERQVEESRDPSADARSEQSSSRSEESSQQSNREDVRDRQVDESAQSTNVDNVDDLGSNGSSILEAPKSVPVTKNVQKVVVSNRQLSDADDAEEYYRQALIAERQAHIDAIQGAREEAQRYDNYLETTAKNRVEDSWNMDLNVRVEQRQSELTMEEMRSAQAVEMEGEWVEIQSFEVAVDASARSGAHERYLENQLQADGRRNPKSQAFLNPEDRDIPQGVTQSVDEIQNGKVITRIVRIGDVVTRYRKVIMKTGTYYFRGDRNISKLRWELETNPTFD